MDDVFGDPNAPSAPTTSPPSEKTKITQPRDGLKKRGKKQRLVSYSSQDTKSSIDDTASRRGERKSTAVTKKGAVMIDNTSKEGEKK